MIISRKKTIDPARCSPLSRPASPRRADPSRWLVAVAAACVLVSATMLLEPATAAAQDEPPLDSVDTSGVTANDVNEVARELWCPLCSGIRLDSCELKACDQMRDVIRIKLAQGESTQVIKDYFVVQYGPQVLGEPPREGFNLLAWILPILVFLGGGVFIVRQGRRMLRKPATSDGPASSQANRPAEDEYQQRLQEELDRYA